MALLLMNALTRVSALRVMENKHKNIFKNPTPKDYNELSNRHINKTTAV